MKLLYLSGDFSIEHSKLMLHMNSCLKILHCQFRPIVLLPGDKVWGQQKCKNGYERDCF